MTCSTCGKTNISTAKCCAACGDKLSQTAPSQESSQPAPSPQPASVIPSTTNMRPCPKCGRDNPTYAGFCGFCASDLSAAAASLIQPAQTYQQAAAGQQAVEPAPVEQQAVEPASVEQQPAQPYQQAPTDRQPAQTYRQAPQRHWTPQAYDETPAQQQAAQGLQRGSLESSGFTEQQAQTTRKPSKLFPILLVLLLVLVSGASGAFYLFDKYSTSNLSAAQAMAPRGTAQAAPTPVSVLMPPVSTSTLAPIAPIKPMATMTPEGMPKLATLESPASRPRQETGHPESMGEIRHSTSSYSGAIDHARTHRQAVVAAAHHPRTSGSHVHILSSPNEPVAERLAGALKQRGFNVHVKKLGGSWSVDTAATKNANQNSSTAQALRKSGYPAGIESN